MNSGYDELDNVKASIPIAKRIDSLLEYLRQSPSPKAQRIIDALQSGNPPLKESSKGKSKAKRRNKQMAPRTEFDVLAEMLADEDPEFVVEAANAIEYQSRIFGRTIRDGWSVPWFDPETEARLVAALRSEYPQVRKSLLSAYQTLEFGSPSEVLPIFVKRLKDHEHEEIPLAALQAIEDLGPDHASPAVDEISELAGDPTPGVRRKVYAILRSLGQEAHSAIPVLVGQVARVETDRELRKEATRTLVAVFDNKATGLERITAEDREPVIQALRDIGEEGRALRYQLASQPSRQETPADVVSASPHGCEWLNKTEIADYLGMDRGTVHNMLTDGRIVPVETRTSGKKHGRTTYLMERARLDELRGRLHPECPDTGNSPKVGKKC